MIQVLQIATSVGTPLALLGLIAALAYFAYTRRLKHAENVLKLLPENERSKATDDYLTRYGIDAATFSNEQKIELIKDEMAKKHRRSEGVLKIAAAVFVACFSLAVVAYVIKPGSDSKDQQRLTQIDEETQALIDTVNQRAEVIRKNMTDRLSDYGTMIGDGYKHQDNFDFLVESIERFDQLHTEYVAALQNQKVELMHERFSKIKDFLQNEKLLSVLKVYYLPNYRVSTTHDEKGNEVMKKFRSWSMQTTNKPRNDHFGLILELEKHLPESADNDKKQPESK